MIIQAEIEQELSNVMPADLLAECSQCVANGECTWDEVVQTIVSQPGGVVEQLKMPPEDFNASVVAFALRLQRMKGL